MRSVLYIILLSSSVLLRYHKCSSFVMMNFGSRGRSHETLSSIYKRQPFSSSDINDKTRNSRSSSKLQSKRPNDLNDSGTLKGVFYNDDAFGLVFLTSLFIVQDYNFCAVFGGLSFASTIFFRKKEDSNETYRISLIVPGILALVSFVLTQQQEGKVLLFDKTTSPTILMAVCFISATWSTIKYALYKEEELL